MGEISQIVEERIYFHRGIHRLLNVCKGHKKEDTMVEVAEKMSWWIVDCVGSRMSLIVMTFIAIRIRLNFLRSSIVHFCFSRIGMMKPLDGKSGEPVGGRSKLLGREAE